MPRISIGTTNIGQASTTNRGSTSQSSLSYIMGVQTYPLQTGDYLLANWTSGYYFWTYVSTSNSNAGNVSITYPWSETANNVGAINQVFTGAYNYITIQCNVNYGYTFNYWSAGYPGGPTVSYSNPYNLYYNDTYYDSGIIANFT